MLDSNNHDDWLTEFEASNAKAFSVNLAFLFAQIDLNILSTHFFHPPLMTQLCCRLL